MEISISDILSIAGWLLGGGSIGGILTWRWTRRKEKAEAQTAEVNMAKEVQDTYQQMLKDKEEEVTDKNRIIKEDPTYGHIICRCESVTEGEILNAIRQNPKPRDLDGVKRRTRAQMGRCQGGFCSPYVVELLAREMGVAYEDVTKFGGNSYINVSKTKEDRT